MPRRRPTGGDARPEVSRSFAEDAPQPSAPDDVLARRQDALLDEAIEETFPASDAISPMLTR